MMLMLNSPFRIVTSHKLAAGHLRMAPEGLFQGLPACGVHDLARPDLPARLGTPVDLRSTSIRGRGFTAYLSGPMPSEVNLGVRRFISAFKSRMIMQSLIRLATFPCHYRPQTRRQSFADGSGGPFQGLPACGVHDRPSGPPRSPRNYR